VRRLALGSSLAVFALVVSSLSVSAADQKPLPWEKNHLQIGQALYRTNCVVCHDIDRPQAESKKFGPSFYRLFRQPKMPLANMPPSRDYMKIRIRFGGSIMPSFARTLSDSEIDTLLDYVQSR
jgi:mono/diheme cytochrome c family protein